MGFPVCPKVSEDKVIRAIWFGDARGRPSIWNQITPLRIKLINAYIDWRDFGIRPWDRRLPAEDIPTFWKDTLRSFRRLENEVQEKRMKESSQASKEMKAMSGTAPSAEAKRDYMKWRKEQIKAHQQQREQHHTIIEQQAMIRKQEHEKRMLLLESRKVKRPKVKRPKRSH